MALQSTPLAPLRLRVGVHTGEVQLRDQANYMGRTINRTARLRDLAHGGKTALSGVTCEMVAERLPDGAWVRQLGTHPLRDLPRPERVVQLCHADLCNDFPPLRFAIDGGNVMIYPFLPLASLALGDLTTARRQADDVVALAKGISLVAALTCRARVEIAQGDLEKASIDAREARDVGADSHGYVTIRDAFECLAHIAGEEGSHREAARLLGAADAARRQTGITRFKIFDADHELLLLALRDCLGESNFQAAWDEGTALTIEESIAYVRRDAGNANGRQWVGRR